MATQAKWPPEKPGGPIAAKSRDQAMTCREAAREGPGAFIRARWIRAGRAARALESNDKRLLGRSDFGEKATDLPFNFFARCGEAVRPLQQDIYCRGTPTARFFN